MRKIKKLKKNDINKNSFTEVGHTINRIRQQEEKYTIILVVFFMALFCVVGYFTLSFNKNMTFSDKDLEAAGSILNNSPKILLTRDNIMDDSLGIKSEVYAIEVNNANAKMMNYQIVFYQDTVLEDECECNNKFFDIKDVRYSLDGENVSYFSNEKGNVVMSGTIDSNSTEIINIRMWLAAGVEKLENINDYHLHGHFVIEEK